MNKIRPSERLSGLLAFLLSGMFYISAGVLALFVCRNSAIEPSAAGSKAVNLNFVQMELKTAAAPEPVPVSAPPEPAAQVKEEILKQPVPKPETVRPEEVTKEPESSGMQTAQTHQESASPDSLIKAAEPAAGTAREADWRVTAIAKVRTLVEREKYYPPAAQKAGYTGWVSVYVHLEPDGMIASYEIKERRGHPLLGKAVETALGKIKGQNIGMALPERFEFLLPVEFELK